MNQWMNKSTNPNRLNISHISWLLHGPSVSLSPHTWARTEHFIPKFLTSNSYTLSARSKLTLNAPVGQLWAELDTPCAPQSPPESVPISQGPLHAHVVTVNRSSAKRAFWRSIEYFDKRLIRSRRLGNGGSHFHSVDMVETLQLVPEAVPTRSLIPEQHLSVWAATYTSSSWPASAGVMYVIKLEMRCIGYVTGESPFVGALV